MNKTAVISGLHIRLDVPTKCQLVEQVLNKSFKTKKEQNGFINTLAQQSFVNPITIKLWCGKYQNTWKLGKTLPTGTMSFAFATIPDDKIPYVTRELESMRNTLAKFKTNAETAYYKNLKAGDTQSTKTPGTILDDLVLNKKAK